MARSTDDFLQAKWVCEFCNTGFDIIHEKEIESFEQAKNCPMCDYVSGLFVACDRRDNG
jgi:rubrerythrin